MANVLLQIQEETYVKLQSSQSVRRMTRSDHENAHASLSNYNLYANDDISEQNMFYISAHRVDILEVANRMPCT